jgi:protein ImuB
MPLVLVAPGNGGARVVGLNRAAQQNGLTLGDLLSNARSKVMNLQTRDADPAADGRALAKLALWATRYTPIVAVWDAQSGADGFFLDIEGCAHLFGGEEALLADIAMRLKQFGLAPRLAIADTAGASWAVARSSRSDCTIVARGAEREALCRLPVTALRLSPGARSLMRRLGLRRIADVIDQPRAPFAARFETEFLQRLDQALGRCPEPLTPILAPPVYRTHATFVEPILSQEHVLVAATRLLEQLCNDLADADAGARVLRLMLFGVDSDVQSLDLGLATASRDPGHIASLIGLRLDRLQLDSGFGFEAAALHVVIAEPLIARQSGLAMGEEHVAPDGLACLVDRLQQRLGSGAVYQLQPVESHIPERAERAVPIPFGKAKAQVLTQDAADNVPSAPRPLLLLPRPEAAEVTALLPDGPPRRFRWRGVLHQVAAAEGPERITPEWWHRAGDAERDYFRVQDTDGRRFWLYRDGLYGQENAPRWYVHGLFA